MAQVCVNQCNQDEHYCEPMQSWSVRLDTDLVNNAQYVRKVEPGASSTCTLLSSAWLAEHTEQLLLLQADR